MNKTINNLTCDFTMYGKDFTGGKIIHKRFGRGDLTETIELVSGEQIRDLYYMLGRAIDEMDRAK